MKFKLVITLDKIKKKKTEQKQLEFFYYNL